MPTDTDLVIKRIRHIRKSKHLRMKDCAKALGGSKKTYRSIEEGNTPISLPELELIAFYLGVTPTALIEKDPNFEPYSIPLRKDIRPYYLILRRKMVGALISVARKSKAVSVDDLQQATQISADKLYAYEQGDMPIPLTELFLISDYLEISHKALFATVWMSDNTQEYPWLKNNWWQEFSKEEPKPDDDVFKELLQALKQMPKTDQAEIAKIILEKLRKCLKTFQQ